MRPRTPGRHRPAALLALVAFGAFAAACSSPTSGPSEGGDDTGSALPVATTDAVPTTPTTAPTTTTTVDPLFAPTTPPPRPPGPAPVINAVVTTDPVVFVTIDDGNVRDDAVIDWLRLKRMPVTAFPTQNIANADPAYFQRLQAADGAFIQTHSISHPNLKKVSAAEQRRQICEPADRFTTLFGVRPRLFRPPYGGYNATTLQIATECRYDAVVHWRASMNNGRLAVAQGDLRAGDIVLMHFRSDLLQNLTALEGILAARGLRVARLEDYVPASS